MVPVANLSEAGLQDAPGACEPLLECKSFIVQIRQVAESTKKNRLAIPKERERARYPNQFYVIQFDSPIPDWQCDRTSWTVMVACQNSEKKNPFLEDKLS